MNKLALLSLCALIAACSSDGSADPARTQTVLGLTADVTSGKTLYTSNCASCHGSDGQSGSARRNVAGVADQNASSVVNVMQTGEDEMPSFSGLSDQQLADILGYVRSL